MELRIIIFLNFLIALLSVLNRLSSSKEPEQIPSKRVKQEKVKSNKKKRIMNYATLALPFIIFLVSSYLTTVQFRKNQVTTEDLETLAPKIEIGLGYDKTNKFYTYPIRDYTLSIVNNNHNSAPITDFRMTFSFEYIIAEVKSEPFLLHGESLNISNVKIMWGKREDGTEISWEILPTQTSLTNHFSLTIEQGKFNNGEIVNTNRVIFSCDKWPENTTYSADIIVDLSKKPSWVIGTKGTYEGTYYYIIKGRQFSKNVKGIIKE